MPKQGKNIYLRKDGRWEGRYPKGKNDGKVKYGYVYRRSYEEVEKKIGDLERFPDSMSERSVGTFEALSKEWLQVHTPELKASSVAKYANTLQSY